MKKRIRLCFWVILLCANLPNISFAQTEFSFHHLLVGSQSDASIAAMDLYRDDFGLLWIATHRGLAKFDGNEMTLIEFSKPGGIDYGRLEIHQIIPLNENQLLLATARKGLFIYHVKTGDFEVFNAKNSDLRSDQIRQVCKDKSGILWITTGAGLDFMKIENRAIHAYQNSSKPFNETAIFNMFQSTWGDFVLTSQSGIFKLESWQNNQPKFKQISSQPNVALMAERIKGEWWIATQNGVLYKFNSKRQVMMDSFIANGNPHSIPHQSIRAVYRDQKNRLWVGTREGLALYDSTSNRFNTFKHQDGINQSLSYSTINGIYDDGRGQVYFLGQSAIDFISPYTKPIEVLNLNSIDSTSPLLTDPLCTFRDSHGRLWLGTSKGLAYVDNTNRDLLVEGSGSWQSNYILDVIELPNQDLYFATSKGLAVLTKDKYDALDFYFYPFKDRQFVGEGAASFLITDLYYDGGEFLWMSTNNGYSRFNIKTQQFQSGRDDKEASPNGGGNAMNKLIQDKSGNIWIGTRSAGLRFISKGNAFKKDKMCSLTNDPNIGTSLSNDAITDIFEDANGQIWVATFYGLNKLDSLIFPDNPEKCKAYFTRFGKVLGWQTEVFTAIQQDRSGNLWVGSVGGLYRFNPENLEIKHYVVPDGLPSDGIVTDGLKMCSDGKLYVSMRYGAAWFHPDSIQLYDAPPSKPILTHFGLFNTEVPTQIMAPPKAGMFLVNGITYTNEVKLKHDQNVISIGFTGLDVLNVSKQRYRYMLEGFERDWVDAGYKNTVTYTNLSPGNYTFKVMSSNGDGIWSPAPAVLSIKVLPPWYKSWWAYALYVLVMISLIWGFIKMRMAIFKREMNIRMEGERKVNEVRMEERELMRQKNARDFHDETGVKLTRINLLTTAASQKTTDQQVKDCLKQIELNTKDLTGSMRDFVWSLDPHKDSLASILQRLQDFGNQLFEYSEVAFVTQSSFQEWQHIELNFDSKFQLLLIFKEAMNNVLKYAKAKSVYFSCEENDRGIAISLKDDGVGFDPSMKRDSYGLKNMQQRANKLNAKLQITSAPGSGSTVMILLPKMSEDK